MRAMFPHCLDEDRCPACETPAALGLCDWHRAGILPQLARPWWVWLIGVAIARQLGAETARRPVLVLSVSPEASAHAMRKRSSRKPRGARRHGVASFVREFAQTTVQTTAGAPS